MIRWISDISTLFMVVVLVAACLLKPASAVASGATGYASKTTEFCISMKGTVQVVGGDYDAATTRFMGATNIWAALPHSGMEVIVPVSPVAPLHNIALLSGSFSHRVKILLQQFSYHFGEDNFLLTDLPPPSLLV